MGKEYNFVTTDSRQDQWSNSAFRRFEQFAVNAQFRTKRQGYKMYKHTEQLIDSFRENSFENLCTMW